MSFHIPKPCTEDWSAMRPEDSGRFCGNCARTVIDFSNMETAAISDYLRQHSGTCGRFRQEQLQQQEQTIRISATWFSRLAPARQSIYAILLFFALGFSACAPRQPQPGQAIAAVRLADTPTIIGKICIPVPDNQLQGEVAPVPDTVLQPAPMIMGAPIPLPPDTSRQH